MLPKKTKRSPERLLAICNTIASGVTSYAKAARINDLSPDAFWIWIKTSQKNPDDETLLVDYLGERLPIAVAVHAARRVALHEVRGRLEEKTMGWDEPVFYQGMPCWKPDPRCVGMSEDDRDMLGYRRDGLLEDENGCVVQNTIHHQGSDALLLRVAEMAFPSEYRPGQNVSSTVTHNGVVGIQHSKPTNYQAGPPPVPPAPVPPQITFVPAPAPETDAELDDMLALPDAALPSSSENILEGPEPEPGETEPEPVPPVASPTVTAPEPLAPDDPPCRAPRTALEARLFAQLEEHRQLVEAKNV